MHISSRTLAAALIGLAIAQLSPAQEYQRRLKIKKGETEYASVKVYPDKIKVERGKDTWEAKLGDASKRKYKDSKGATAAEIKIDGADFKLRADGGTLRWKVKASAEKIKLSDNEDGKNPYEISIRKSENRCKIKKAEKELAQVKFYPDKKKLKLKDVGNAELFEADSEALSAALGALAVAEASEVDRLILAAELFFQKR